MIKLIINGGVIGCATFNIGALHLHLVLGLG